jgi:hypothetical protein
LKEKEAATAFIDGKEPQPLRSTLSGGMGLTFRLQRLRDPKGRLALARSRILLNGH